MKPFLVHICYILLESILIVLKSVFIIIVSKKFSKLDILVKLGRIFTEVNSDYLKIT